MLTRADGRDTGYAYRYRQGILSQVEMQARPSQEEVLKMIKSTILSMTAGCEICQYATGPFCQKHRRSVKPGDPRCEYFVRRTPEDHRKVARAEYRQLVVDRLGVRGDLLDRLTGED